MTPKVKDLDVEVWDLDGEERDAVLGEQEVVALQTHSLRVPGVVASPQIRLPPLSAQGVERREDPILGASGGQLPVDKAGGFPPGAAWGLDVGLRRRHLHLDIPQGHVKRRLRGVVEVGVRAVRLLRAAVPSSLGAMVGRHVPGALGVVVRLALAV